ncbi:zinc finger CCCH domain-containing protein 34-like isoform X1 [Camellia sinensis]|uniref:zinc finger CCCH domain-containing protein 34-like isoform X1 n=1 Tax=Camellia sinensis TaxID=4442 RepID=UPI001035FED0|nr:zinc finger CCCH domain-containing protein 34-like isoform X1 [Camellia sinensis]
MERYGRATAMEGSQSDPGGETGLEEPMWQLGFGSGVESYPERPDEADCIYYLRTGFCGYGSRCRFNHPRDRGSVVGVMRAGGGEFPERVGEPVCQYYMRTGMCKFGASCKYHHPQQGGGSAIPMTLNIYGYPFRPGEKECSYYVKTGQCKFGVTCKFHHPHPAGIQMPAPNAGPLPMPAPVPAAIYPSIQSPSAPSSQQYGVVAGNWPVARPTLVQGSYLQGAYSPVLLSTGMVPFSGWNPYQASVNPVASPSSQSTIGASPIYGLTQLSPSAPAYAGAYLPLHASAGPSSSNQREYAFPERPGQPECQYYIKTGNCKFGSSCRYHHPLEWSLPQMNFVLSPMGLPLRPGAQLCTHYAQNGVCKFGSSCKFDHPLGTLSYSSSASSLADMPVAPYPVGSSMGTLAPSSSSELRHELILGSNKDAISTRMSSSTSTSSGSVGLILSKSGPASHPSVQQSDQASASSITSSSVSQGGEVHTSI